MLHFFRPGSAREPHDAFLFNGTFLTVVLGSLVFATGLLLGLECADALPPPPFTATPCIDSKFQFLQRSELDGVNLVAVGSSVTLHNLNFSVLKSRYPQLRPMNAAPCHLYVDQTAFYTDFLLAEMHDVAAVIAVFSPRDFSDCAAEDTEFFNTILARWYIFGKHSGWPVYLQGLGAMRFIKALRARRANTQWDAYGAMPMYMKRPTDVPAQLDARCFPQLSKLEEIVTSHGARLIVATLPPMPQWIEENDRNGSFLQTWHARIRNSLRNPRTVLIDGRGLQLSDDEYADPLHLLWPHTEQFTSYVAARLRPEIILSEKSE